MNYQLLCRWWFFHKVSVSEGSVSQINQSIFNWVTQVRHCSRLSNLEPNCIVHSQGFWINLVVDCKVIWYYYSTRINVFIDDWIRPAAFDCWVWIEDNLVLYLVRVRKWCIRAKFIERRCRLIHREKGGVQALKDSTIATIFLLVKHCDGAAVDCLDKSIHTGRGPHIAICVSNVESLVRLRRRRDKADRCAMTGVYYGHLEVLGTPLCVPRVTVIRDESHIIDTSQKSIRRMRGELFQTHCVIKCEQGRV